MEEVSNQHIVRKTAQWQERAVRYAIIPRGCLCVELTPSGKTKIKIGEGTKYYEQLPYIGADVDLSSFFTREELETMIKDQVSAILDEVLSKGSILRLVGSIAPSKDALPKRDNTTGEIRFVKNPKPTADDMYIEYIWTGDRWERLGSATNGDVDLSQFAKADEVNKRLSQINNKMTTINQQISSLESKSHTHVNQRILDNTTASFTLEDKAKLDSIEEGANKYVLPNATRHSKGGIIVGDGLLIDDKARLSIDPDTIPSSSPEQYAPGSGIRFQKETNVTEIINAGVTEISIKNGQLVVQQNGESISFDLPAGGEVPDFSSILVHANYNEEMKE